MIKYSDFNILFEKDLISKYNMISFKDLQDFIKYCNFEDFVYEEIPIISTENIPISFSWKDDDIIFKNLDIPETDIEEPLMFVVDELSEFAETADKEYFNDGIFYANLTFTAKRTEHYYFYDNPLSFNNLDTDINDEFKKSLKDKIEYINNQIEIVYGCPKLDIQNLIKDKNISEKLKKLQYKYGINDNNTISDYMTSWIKKYLEKKKSSIEFNSEVWNILIQRWTTDNKSLLNDILKMPMSSQAFNYIKELEKNKNSFYTDLKNDCLKEIEDIINESITVLSTNMKTIYNNYPKKIINNINNISKDDIYTSLNSVKTFIVNVDNIGGFDNMIFKNYLFVSNNILYKKLKFINNNMSIIIKLK